jgi:hypothetical protein
MHARERARTFAAELLGARKVDHIDTAARADGFEQNARVIIAETAELDDMVPWLDTRQRKHLGRVPPGVARAVFGRPSVRVDGCPDMSGNALSQCAGHEHYTGNEPDSRQAPKREYVTN